jgi:hypothetical protein
MGLPLHTRAAALAASLSVTAAVIITVAEVGHPPPDGAGLLAFLVDTSSAAWAGTAKAEEPASTRVAAEMPQP